MKIQRLWILTPLSVSIFALGCGCSQEGDAPPVRDYFKVQASDSKIIYAKKLIQLDGEEFDFGSQLSRGQTLHHAFKLKNDTDRTVHILGSESLRPCCSSCGPLPKTIEGGQLAEIPVNFNAGLANGPQYARFLITTDSQPSRLSFGVRVNLTPEYEIQSEGGEIAQTRLGKTKDRLYRMICRKSNVSGREAPDMINADHPLVACFADEGPSREEKNNLLETTRVIKVTLPAIDVTGPQQGFVHYKWGTETSYDQLITWQVVSSLEVHPSAIVVSRLEKTQDKIIVVRSTDQSAFAITGVKGTLFADKPVFNDKKSFTHTLQLKLKLNEAPSETPSDIVIDTDHPEQKSVKITVITLPG